MYINVEKMTVLIKIFLPEKGVVKPVLCSCTVSNYMEAKQARIEQKTLLQCRFSLYSLYAILRGGGKNLSKVYYPGLCIKIEDCVLKSILPYWNDAIMP